MGRTRWGRERRWLVLLLAYRQYRRSLDAASGLARPEDQREENRDIRENVEKPQMAESLGAAPQGRYAEFAGGLLPSSESLIAPWNPALRTRYPYRPSPPMRSLDARSNGMAAA